MSFRPSQRITFCVPARFVYRGAGIVSVLKLKNERRAKKKGLFALVETITGENQIS